MSAETKCRPGFNYFGGLNYLLQKLSFSRWGYLYMGARMHYTTLHFPFAYIRLNLCEKYLQKMSHSLTLQCYTVVIIKGLQYFGNNYDYQKDKMFKHKVNTSSDRIPF